nr:hypothetical protein [Tanacetum cinerariifolium]
MYVDLSRRRLNKHLKPLPVKELNLLLSSQPSGFGAHEGTGVTPRVLDVPTYESDGDDDGRTNSDNDGDDFVHPKFSTHDEEDKEEDSFDPRVQTPSHVRSTNDEDSNEEIHGVNVKGDELDEEETNEDDEEMNYTGTPDTGIDSIFNLNIESASLVDVSVTTITEPPLLFATTIPPPPTPLITHLQQTPVPTPKIQKTIIEQLEAEVLTHSSNESKTSHAVAANVSELELKKILIDKIESTKSIHRSDE